MGIEIRGVIKNDWKTFTLVTPVDRSGNDAYSKHINYMDSKIGLKLPVPISEISDYDLSAPFVSERGVVGE